MFKDSSSITKIFMTTTDRNKLVTEFENIFKELNSDKTFYLDLIEEKYPNIKDLFDIIRLD